MSQEFVLQFASTFTKLLLLASMAGLPASAQQMIGATSSSSDDALISTLPDALSSQSAQNGLSAQNGTPVTSPAYTYQGAIGPIPPLLTKTPLTFHNKFTIYAHQAFGPPALVFPALGAGLRMGRPSEELSARLGRWRRSLRTALQ